MVTGEGEDAWLVVTGKGEDAWLIWALAIQKLWDQERCLVIMHQCCYRAASSPNGELSFSLQDCIFSGCPHATHDDLP